MIRKQLVAGLVLLFSMSLAFAAEGSSHAGWISVLPPLAAIAIALVFRQIIPALFVALWIGAWALHDLSFSGIWVGLLDTIQIYVVGAIADTDHVSIIVFSMMIGGMVGIISRNGGMQGIVNYLVRWANNARRASISTGLMGLAIFFDDYANTLVVGNTMRPVTDRLRVSREKLAYIVDSTAAPVACLAFITTWIGYEIGLIDEAMKSIGADLDPYAVFLSSVPYSFYPIMAIAFVFFNAFLRKDFGPMYQAEVKMIQQGKTADEAVESNDMVSEEIIQPIEGKPQRAINALIPIIVLIGGVIIGIYATGYKEGSNLREIVSDANSYKALLWGSLLSVLTAVFLSVIQGIMSLKEATDAWFKGARSLLMAMLILVLAWSLSKVTDGLGTANYLVSLLGDSLNPGVVPTLVFLLAAATAFSTGSSWATMAILMPLVIPLTWAVIGGQDASTTQMHIVYSAVSAVLAGSVWGDHCSPISDTTILSSMASGCDHIEHVRTQLPYALLVGLVALGVGTLPAGFGVPWWICLIAGLGILFGILRIAGQSLPDAQQPQTEQN